MVAGVHRGRHLLIDCNEVPRSVCLDDQGILDAMARAARRAGATVISQVRYRFGHESAPGFTAMVLLDESHCSAHSYADLGQIALDIFTCGKTSPQAILEHLREEIDLGSITTRQLERFSLEDGPAGGGQNSTGRLSSRINVISPALRLRTPTWTRGATPWSLRATDACPQPLPMYSSRRSAWAS